MTLGFRRYWCRDSSGHHARPNRQSNHRNRQWLTNACEGSSGWCRVPRNWAARLSAPLLFDCGRSNWLSDCRRDGPESVKARKDRTQARFLVNVLADERPDELAEAYRDALSRGPKWEQRLEATVRRLPDVAERHGSLLPHSCC
jgi:hypothetical protein